MKKRRTHLNYAKILIFIRKEKKPRWENWVTSSGNAKTELEDDSTKITAKASFVGAIDRDDGGFIGILRLPDHNEVFKGYSHDSEVVWLHGRMAAGKSIAGARSGGSGQWCCEVGERGREVTSKKIMKLWIACR